MIVWIVFKEKNLKCHISFFVTQFYMEIIPFCKIHSVNPHQDSCINLNPKSLIIIKDKYIKNVSVFKYHNINNQISSPSFCPSPPASALNATITIHTRHVSKIRKIHPPLWPFMVLQRLIRGFIISLHLKKVFN